MSTLETKGREPKVFMIADERDYKYYIDPAIEIIRHEGTGTFIYEGNYGHPDIEVTYEPINNLDGLKDYQLDTPDDKQWGWKANGIPMMLSQVKGHLYDSFCQG